MQVVPQQNIPIVPQRQNSTATIPTENGGQQAPEQNERVSAARRKGIPRQVGNPRSVFERLTEKGQPYQPEMSQAASSQPREQQSKSGGARRKGKRARQPDDREESLYSRSRRSRSPYRKRHEHKKCNISPEKDSGNKLQGDRRDVREYLDERRREKNSPPSCFARWIENASPDDRITQAHFPLYNGKTKALDHIMAFEVKIKLVTSNEALWCRAFATTFQGKTISWYTRLPSGSIDGWAQFKEVFLKQYGLAGVSMTDDMSLLNFRQKSGETIAKFTERFKAAVELIDNPDEKHAIGCYISNLNLGTLKTTLTFQTPSTLAALYQDCSKMSQIEESQRDEQSSQPHKV